MRQRAHIFVFDPDFRTLCGIFAALFCLAPLHAQSVVTLGPDASPAVVQPGFTSISITGSGFPAGVIDASNVTVKLTPAAGGHPAPVRVTATQPLFGSTEQITFVIPVSFSVIAPTIYQVSLSGTSSLGNSFVSGNSAAITVDPPARIVSISPPTGTPAFDVTVAITGQYTNFLPGVTQAFFGDGITVGGVRAAPGPVTVTSPTTAIANLTLDGSALPGPRKVIVSTGEELLPLENGFTVGSQPATINVDLTNTTAIAPKISGFNDGHIVTGVEYYDPKFVAAVRTLNPGWIRFPGGTPEMAFDWQTGHESQSWINYLTPKIDFYTAAALTTAQELTQAAGGVYFADFATFIKQLGIPGLICFNGFTDTNPGSAGKLAASARDRHVDIIDWELSNEPYFYPNLFATPAAYAAAMDNPYFQNITAVTPNANVSLFFEGKYDFYTDNYTAWDNAMAAYTSRYWNSVSTHVYPIIDTNISVADEEGVLNGVLAHGTNEYVSSYLVPLIGADTPIFITEMNSSVDKVAQGDSHPNYTGAVAFESYLYNGIFLAEYATRMSTVPNMRAVGVTSLYLGNEFNYGMLRAADDHQGYLVAQVKKNPNFSTDTATNPYTQFQFYTSAPGLAMAVVNQAINSSTHIWSTTVTGGPQVRIIGFDNKPVPAVFSQAYMGDNGTNYLVITNKSNIAVPVIVQVNGQPLQGNLSLFYVSNSRDTAENTGDAQTVVQIQTATSTNPITLGPYSVTRVEW